MKKFRFACIAFVICLGLGLSTWPAMSGASRPAEQDSQLLPDQRGSQNVGQAASPRQTTETSALTTPMLTHQVVTGVLASETSCVPPTPKSVFAPTDARVYHWTSLSGATVGDLVRWEFIQPDGFTYFSTLFRLTFGGDVCFWASINIAGQPAANLPGNWEVRVFYNNVFIATGPFSITGQGGGGQGRICRRELSVFYAGMQSLGGAWGRPACPFEPDPLAPRTIADMQGALNNAIAAVNAIPCIRFDVGRFSSLSSRLPGMRNQQAINEHLALIQDLQLAARNARCDGVNLESLLVAGINLGAAQAWASCFQCQMTVPPIPPNIQTVILNHLTTARNGLMAFSACLPGFDFNIFNTVPVGSMNSIEPHTFIVGIHTLVLWNVALSDCCCTCSG